MAIHGAGGGNVEPDLLIRTLAEKFEEAGRPRDLTLFHVSGLGDWKSTGLNLLTGRFAREGGENIVTGSMWFHIGSNMDQRVQVFIGTMTSKALGVRNVGDDSILALDAPDGANRAIGTLDFALKKVNKQRADLGAYQNRLEHAIRGIDIGAENLQAAESRIRDADMAAEMVNFTKDRILAQAGNAMLAQANQKTQQILQLLQ